MMLIRDQSNQGGVRVKRNRWWKGLLFGMLVLTAFAASADVAPVDRTLKKMEQFWALLLILIPLLIVFVVICLPLLVTYWEKKRERMEAIMVSVPAAAGAGVVLFVWSYQFWAGVVLFLIYFIPFLLVVWGIELFFLRKKLGKKCKVVLYLLMLVLIGIWWALFGICRTAGVDVFSPNNLCQECGTKMESHYYHKRISHACPRCDKCPSCGGYRVFWPGQQQEERCHCDYWRREAAPHSEKWK